MSENIENAVPLILKKIQEELSSFRTSVDTRFDQIAERLDRIEDVQRKQRRDSAGMLVMMRATAGDFDERVTEVEERVMALEARGA